MGLRRLRIFFRGPKCKYEHGRQKIRMQNAQRIPTGVPDKRTRCLHRKHRRSGDFFSRCGGKNAGIMLSDSNVLRIEQHVKRLGR